jgi:hypothetical protein
MKAITVEPLKPETARLEDVADPDVRDGSVLVEAIAVGVCGTDVEIVEGKYGWAPRGKTRLVLGHESLGRVLDPGPSALKQGDLVVGIVRRPDPVPCPNCAVGRGHVPGRLAILTRHQGDRRLHIERWRIGRIRDEGRPSLGLLGVLLGPTTVVTKAWSGSRRRHAPWGPDRAGDRRGAIVFCPVGKQHGLDVHVLDRVVSGPA